MKQILFLSLVVFMLFSCKKSEVPKKISNEIEIISLDASFRTIKAWDTTSITVIAKGENLSYFWEANHGDIKGNGSQIKYAAGNCCVGLNTITCRVFNETGFVEDTIQIRVKHYLDN
ncbi:MAG: hypothetical protein Q8J88_08375 [Bacteroidales bacterium]|nr:hypothetical protein [Bacteroidales bacterium]